VFKIASFSHTDFPCHCSFLFTFENVATGRHSRRHCSDCRDEKLVFEGVHSKEVDRQIFMRKAGQRVVLISCWKSCGTQAQLIGRPRTRSAHTEENVETVNDLVKKITMPSYA